MKSEFLFQFVKIIYLQIFASYREVEMLLFAFIDLFPHLRLNLRIGYLCLRM